MKKIFTTLAGLYLNFLAFVAPKKAAKQGFQLFCRPFRGAIKDYHKKFLSTADQFSFEHDGITIHAYRWGHGSKKVLFLHGWQSHSFRWKAYIEALDKEAYSVYAFDAPGHGLSGGNYLNVPFYGNIMIQLVETIGEVDTVIGHSLGGFSALYMMHQRPSLKINRLLLMAPPGEAKDFIAFYKKTLGLSDRTMALINDQFTKEFQEPITWFSTERFAATLNIPGLIIHDEEDAEAPYHYATRIHRVWPKSDLVTTKGLGHNLKSAEIVKIVTNFIKDDNLSSRNGTIKHGKGVEAY